MGKKLRIGMGLASVVLAGSIFSTAFAGSNGTSEPGSIDDPVVTKSYVDQQVSQLLEIFNQQPSKPDDSNNNTGSNGSDTDTTQPVAVAPIIVEELTAGDILVGKAGAEIIVRNGNVVVYGPGDNGVPDVTGGADIAVGAKVPLNHQLIIPRDDGRGVQVKADSKGTTYIMVRGRYEVIEAQ